MGTILLPLIALTWRAFAGDCITTPCSFAGNYSFDLVGTADSRADTWGTAASQSKPIKFRPPAGYRVRILRVYGDFVIWPRGTVVQDPNDAVIGKAVGTLFGLKSTAPDGSSTVEGAGASDGCFLYLQVASKGETQRAGFDHDTHVGGLLEADNTMLVVAAVWLNSTGLAIHIEPTVNVVYIFEAAK